MTEAFPTADRGLFQLLSEHPLESMETLVEISRATSASALRRRIKGFCERYQCHIRAQIINWEQIGLQSAFVLTDEPLEHPYAIREYQLIGRSVFYLTQLLSPDLHSLDLRFSDIYHCTQIYRPTNAMRLLYSEARTISFNDEWLLNLKEVMVEQEMGDIVYHQEIPSPSPITIDNQFLERLSKIYLYNELGRIKIHKHTEFIQSFPSFITPFMDIQIPGMENYLLILDNTVRPQLFVGGFLGRFPLTELYETSNALICRFQLPEPNFAKLSLMLFTHLIEVCTPYIWLLKDDKRMFHLEEQWVNGQWAKF